MTDFSHDVIVIGHGLAGAVLMQQLLDRGLRVHVFDAPRSGSASIAAAGVVNPISLRRDVITWRAPEMLAAAERHYTTFERAHGVRIWHPLELIKLFPNPAQADQWQRAMAREASAPFLSNSDRPELQRDHIPAPHGYGTVLRCAWLDLPHMLRTQREQLIAMHCLTERSITPADIQTLPDGISVHGISASWMIDCAGPFAEVPGLVPVKGEVLTVRIPGLGSERIIHRGVFILPIGDQLFRIGSTYKWNTVWTGPTQEARDYLMGKLQEVIPGPLELVDHRAGVRPASRDRRPLLGITAPHRAVMNGLGSRGVMLAPWSAAQLIAHLFEGQPLDHEANIARFSGS